MSITQTTDVYSQFKIYLTEVQNTHFCITAVVTDAHADPFQTAEAIYKRIVEIIAHSGGKIIHERIFGEISIYPKILAIRNQKIQQQIPDDPGLVTYIEGKSCYRNPFAGIQIRIFRPSHPNEMVKTLWEGKTPWGRLWNRNGATFLQLQNLSPDHFPNGENRQLQAETMFRKAEAILKSQGASYRNVVRTWIYVDQILDWYHEFNKARNACYTDFGLLRNGELEHAEKIYLPASTGIAGKNPQSVPAIMDLLAVAKSSNSDIQIYPLSGARQRSPYRYGSAFSRAMCVVEPKEKWIFVSGTASINEQGESVHQGDMASQVRHTFEVVETLVCPEGISISNLCEATVFLKRQEDFTVYQKTAEALGFSNIPAVYLIADVCRDELLFELDGTFVTSR